MRPSPPDNLWIGIDASRAISKSPTGTEGYSFNLLRALIPKLCSRYRVTLYFRQHPDADDFSGATVKVIPCARLWTHIRLSGEMLMHKPDLLFVPAHVIPLVHPRKSLVTVHDLGYRYFPRAHTAKQRLYLDLSTRWNVHMASHVLTDSNATRDAVVKEYRISPEKISVVYPGYDSTLSHQDDPNILSKVKARYGILGDYILYIGSIQPRKNLQRLIGAFRMLLSNHPHLQLVLAGPEGWLAGPIREYVQKQELQQYVIFPGYIAEEDKSVLISGARVFAYPSLYEGFGFPALEAQACGTPLLTSTTSSLPEVSGDGAVFVDPENIQAIADGLRQLLEQENVREYCVSRGYQNILRFSWEKTAIKVRGIIDTMLL